MLDLGHGDRVHGWDGDKFVVGTAVQTGDGSDETVPAQFVIVWDEGMGAAGDTIALCCLVEDKEPLRLAA
jgi:hypothetical protein